MTTDENPDSDICGLRVKLVSGAFGTVIGRNTLGHRWRVPLDASDPPGLQPCICDSLDLVKAGPRPVVQP